MVHKHVAKDDPEAGSAVAPPTPSDSTSNRSPRTDAGARSSRPDAVYRLIHDELLLDGSSRLNMATFVTTWMEPEADRLMAETFDKNMIDKDEYPQTAEIERRCVNIVANLFNAPEDGDAVGVSTIGSSEAVMLAGLAMKWQLARPREARRRSRPTSPTWSSAPTSRSCGRSSAGTGTSSRATSRCAQGRYVVDPDEVVERVDENTIGVIPILGTTYTGEFEPIKEIHDAGGRLQRRRPASTCRARRRGERRVRRPVPAPRPGVGLPPAAGEVDQRVGPQVRPHVPGRRVRRVARRARTCPRTWSST